MSSQQQVVHSALWAAYGDVVGFITELTDANGLRKRTGTVTITGPVPWTRRVGGRFGVPIKLPAGTYSDDTQLRLATSRAIRASGEFDVDAFSKIELPVWRAYALGGGRGTTAAAAELAKKNVTWLSNFFDGHSDYTQGGGNGAAMRIQPHVWASRRQNDSLSYLPDVVRNSLCTHGHPHGILGAVFHAASLAQTLNFAEVPGPDDWIQALHQMRDAVQFMSEDEEIGLLWVPQWERTTGQAMRAGFQKVIDETEEAVEKLASMFAGRSQPRYSAVVQALQGFDPKHRGTGTTTAVLASALAWLAKDDPEKGVLAAANLLGTDTDTIGTMAGAILGAACPAPPPGEIKDKHYIQSEAERLWAISTGSAGGSFSYPDLLKWTPPANQGDAVGEFKGRLTLAGLGFVTRSGSSYEQSGKGAATWQWLQLEFGQTVLAKRKERPVNLPPSSVPIVQRRSDGRQEDLFGKPEILAPGRKRTTEVREPLSTADMPIDELMVQITTSEFDPLLIGKVLLNLALQPNGIDRAVAAAALISREYRFKEQVER
jgi:ADP-ribosylglycohydrolase